MVELGDKFVINPVLQGECIATKQKLDLINNGQQVWTTIVTLRFDDGSEQDFRAEDLVRADTSNNTRVDTPADAAMRQDQERSDAFTRLWSKLDSCGLTKPAMDVFDVERIIEHLALGTEPWLESHILAEHKRKAEDAFEAALSVLDGIIFDSSKITRFNKYLLDYGNKYYLVSVDYTDDMKNKVGTLVEREPF